MRKRILVAIPSLYAFLLITGCSNLSIKGGTSGISESRSGQIDNDTGDIIRQEQDEDGRMRDCTVGNSSERRNDLPSCNEVVNRRESQSDRDSQISDGLLTNKLTGSQVFVLPNGSKIRIKTSVKYNDETSTGRGGGELIINSLVEKINSTDTVFENLFINRGAKVEIAFIDSDDFSMLQPLTIPLNITEGQSRNISYRKKFGQTTAQVIGVAMQARVPISSIREYKQIARLDVAFKPN